jgi:carbonic anhydrase/acetyltransferase-like protein (isoleucine patch superfamily)
MMGVPAREKRALSDEERTASRENARRYVRNAAAYRDSAVGVGAGRG